MKDIIYAGQSIPFDLLHKKIKFPKEKKQLVSYMEIVKKNFPNASENELIRITYNLFLEIKRTGCAMTAVANILAKKLGNTPEKAIESFGFDLTSETTEQLDYNKVLIDLGCKLYKQAKVYIYDYEYFAFDTMEDAAEALLQGEDLEKYHKIVKSGYNIDLEASRMLFNNGFMAAGLTEDKKLKFRSPTPTKKEMISSLADVALKELGIDKQDITEKELKELFAAKGSTINIEDISIPEKFSGLLPKSKTFWTNYYLKSLNADVEVEVEMKEFDNNEDFYQRMEECVSNDYGVVIASTPRSEVFMHTNKKLSYVYVNDGNRSGHAMTFKKVDENGNVIVSSWGKDYIIDKEYIPQLEISIFKVKQKENINEHNKNS